MDSTGGVAFTGGTGEEYAIPFYNSIVLETDDPEEIESHVLYLDGNPAESERLRRAARETARQYTWERVIEILIRKLEYRARTEGLLVTNGRIPVSDQRLLLYPEVMPKREAVLSS